MSRGWPFLLVVLFLLGVILRVYYLSAFALMLLIAAGLVAWSGRRALEDIHYRRRPFYRRGFPGETFPLQLEVENRKLLPLSWLRVEDHWPTAVGPEDESLFSPSHRPEEGALVNLYTLRWFEKKRRRYTLLMRKRGVYRLGPVKLSSGDFFGMFTREQELDQTETLTVFPQPVPLGERRIPTEDPFGDHRTRRNLFEDPTLPMGVRDYHPEDDFRFVHWPATARTGALQVRVFQPASAQVVVMCLNVSTLQHYWEGTNPELLEQLVGITATLVQEAIEAGYRVGLASNGCLAHADQPFRVPPGRSPDQLAHLLTALASVTSFTAATFDRFLLAEAPRLPYGAALFVITALTPPELIEALLRLKQRGRKITLLSLAQQVPPHIPGVQLIHLPYSQA